MRTRTTIVALSLLALLLAACGGGGGDSTTTAGATATTAAEAGGTTAAAGDDTTAAETTVGQTSETTTAGGSSGEGVTMGILAPFSGEMGSFGEYVANGYETARAEINTSGLLACGPIEFITADDETSPEVGRQEAQRMIGEGAVAIMGPTSDILLAIAPLAQEAEVVASSPYAGSTEVADVGGDFVFRTVGADINDGIAAASWISDEGYGSVAVLTQQEEQQQSAGSAARAAFEQLGTNIVADQQFAPGEASYSGILATVMGSSPEIIYLAGGQESSLTIINEASQLGYAGDWLFSADLATDEVIQAAGADTLEGVAHTVVSSTDPSTEQYMAFATAHEEVTGEPPGPFGANAYDNLILFGLAMVAADECTGPAINGAVVDVSREGTEVNSFEEGATLLSEGEDIDYQGASGPVDFDDQGTVTNSYSVQQVQSGVWAEVAFYTPDDVIELED
ncbi:MAG: ABC transporter substrate-binding protein [Acidimicrobiia bacterium]|nr:ABC transporter substrate-binding protein [Acidimicrobiia bacterium]